MLPTLPADSMAGAAQLLVAFFTFTALFVNFVLFQRT